MELFDKLKIYVPIALTVASTITSGVFMARDYLSSNYVSISRFDDMRLTAAITILENRKSLLENRLYFLDVCKSTPTCQYKDSVVTDIEKTKRDLDDTRKHLEVMRSKRLD
jgi:hypothetical protein